jgi:hypothetical protein
MAEQKHELVVVVNGEEAHFTVRSTDGAIMRSIAREALILSQTSGTTHRGLATLAADLRNALEPLDRLSEAASETSSEAAAAAAMPEGAAAAAAAAAAAPTPAAAAPAPAPAAAQANPAPVARTRAQVEEHARLTFDARMRQTRRSGVNWSDNYMTADGNITRGAGWLCDDDTWYQARETGRVYNTLTEVAHYRCREEGCGRRHWEVRCPLGENRQQHEV